MADLIASKKCLNCHSDLSQKKGKLAPVFCSNSCRSNYWQRSDRLEKAGKPIEEVVKILNQNPSKKRVKLKNLPKVVANTPAEVKKEVSDNMDNQEILAQIAAIRAEKIPELRNTTLGRKSWNIEQEKKIAELKSKLK